MGQVCPPLGSRSSKICLIGNRSACNNRKLLCLLRPCQEAVLWAALNVAGETERASWGGSDGKEPACNADVALIPGSGRSAGGGKGCPLQCSGLESSVDRGASRASGHGLTESDTTEGVTAARGAGGSAQAPRRPPAGCGTLVGEPLGHFAQSASPRVPEMLFPTRDPKEGCLAVGGLCFPRKKACTHSGQSRDHRSIPVSLASPEAERRLPPWMW